MLIDADGRKMSFHEIKRKFDKNQLDALGNYPKLFFNDSCREIQSKTWSDKYDLIARGGNNITKISGDETECKRDNMYTFYSTSNTRPIYENRHGGQMAEAITNVLERDIANIGEAVSLQDIELLTKNRIIASTQDIDKFEQMPEVTNHLKSEYLFKFRENNANNDDSKDDIKDEGK